MLLVLGVLWAAWIISYVSMIPFLNYIGPSPLLFSSIGGLAVFTTIAIPILGLMLLITRWFSSYRIPEKWRTNLRLGWVAAFVIALLTGFGTGMSFNHEADVTTVSEYSSSDQTLMIRRMPTRYQKSNGIISSPFHNLQFAKGGLISSSVHLDVVKSKSDKIMVETIIHSHGKSTAHAQNLVKRIDARHTLKDNVLMIPQDFKIVRGSKFRAQHIHYKIHVPEGSDIAFDESTADKIWHMGYFRDGIRPYHLEKYTWTMTNDGLASVGWDKEYRAERIIETESLENLNIDGKINASISYGEETQVLVKGHKNEIEKIEKVVTDGTTSLIVNNRIDKNVILEIKTPKLNSLQAKGLRSLKIEGFKQKDMELNFSGRMSYDDIKVYVDVENLSCNIGGDNDITFLGSGKSLSVNILDNSRITAEQYKVEKVAVTGNLKYRSSFYASESFECPSHERHSVTLYGNPELLAESEKTSE
ncbi:MAG: DUF2807 domain-containing protein [Bacteroidota bacterium]